MSAPTAFTKDIDRLEQQVAQLSKINADQTRRITELRTEISMTQQTYDREFAAAKDYEVRSVQWQQAVDAGDAAALKHIAELEAENLALQARVAEAAAKVG